MPLTPRPARTDDYPHFARFFAELRVPEPAPSPEKFTRNFMPSAFFLEEGANLVAYGCTYPIGTFGMVLHVVVAPEARGRGVGAAVMRECAARLKAARCTHWRLNVKPDNVPAIRLYERFGMRRTITSVSLRVYFRQLSVLAPAERDLSVVPLAGDGSEHERIEQAFDLPRGALAQRQGLGRLLLRLRDAGDPSELALGVAAFDPDFPGANPFRVREPAFARALLEGMRARARPEHDSFRVFVEGDPELAAHLRAAGAETTLEAVCMEAVLP